MKRIFKNMGIIVVLQLFFVFQAVSQSSITAENALASYLNNGDNTYKWEVKDSFDLGNVAVYDLLLTSQKYRHMTWKHQLTLYIPSNRQYDGALLFIDGGSNDTATHMPNWKDTKKKAATDMLIRALAGVAEKNKAIVANLKQVPNQPIFGGLKEDAAISYTLHHFLEDRDYSWPLLFPMVKSAHKAMDAVQEFTGRKGVKINRFVVSGASKRGWTTWLTGASDPRVVAIAPMVIDILNMPINLKHQLDAYGEYSSEINDYVKLGVIDGMNTPTGNDIVKMIDPYSYRENLKMPKLIMMGSNDPYWVIDNVKNYLPDIPGHNLLNYTPNAGHNLNGGIVAFPALSAFFGITMDKGKYPSVAWSTKKQGNNVVLNIKATRSKLVSASMWSADSKKPDFRLATWKSREVNIGKKKKFDVNQELPESGYRAFYLDLKYENPNGGTYTVSTRAFMADANGVM